MDKKSILYITNYPSPYSIDFYNDLGEKYDLTVIFEELGVSCRDKSWEQFEASNFGYKILKNSGADGKSEIRSGIKKVLREKKYDLYIIGVYASVSGITANLWLRRHGLDYAIHADGGLIASDNFLKYHIKKYLLKGASLYFSSGKMTNDYFVHYGAIPARIRQYPLSSVRESEIITECDVKCYREKLGLDKDSNIIVSVGQIIPRKGFDTLLEAVSKLKNKCKLYIIGGTATPELSRLLEELKLDNVEFIPFIPFKEVLNYIAAADVFAFLTREDIWGLVINEAFAMGTPIVSTNKCVAAVEMIEDGINGYVVNAEDPDAAAEKIDVLLEDKVTLASMRNANRIKAKEYTLESMCKAYCNILDEYFSK